MRTFIMIRILMTRSREVQITRKQLPCQSAINHALDNAARKYRNNILGRGYSLFSSGIIIRIQCITKIRLCQHNSMKH